MIEVESLNLKLAGTGFKLEWVKDALSLCHQEFSPLTIDFLSNQFQYRTSQHLLAELVAKACGAKQKPQIIDLTAGLGRDAFILASLGCQVLMVERSPLMHALLADGLSRLKQHNEEFPLTLVSSDSRDFLKNKLDDLSADVIYIDPMHPERHKSALVKKEMRILRAVVGADEDKEELITLALNSRAKRVVVKWPLKVGSNIELKPTASFKGKSTRFDVYQIG